MWDVYPWRLHFALGMRCYAFVTDFSDVSHVSGTRKVLPLAQPCSLHTPVTTAWGAFVPVNLEHECTRRFLSLFLQVFLAMFPQTGKPNKQNPRSQTKKNWILTMLVSKSVLGKITLPNTWAFHECYFSPFIQIKKVLEFSFWLFLDYLTPNLIPYCFISRITAAYLLRKLWYFVDIHSLMVVLVIVFHWSLWFLLCTEPLMINKNTSAFHFPGTQYLLICLRSSDI